MAGNIDDAIQQLEKITGKETDKNSNIAKLKQLASDPDTQKLDTFAQKNPVRGGWKGFAFGSNFVQTTQRIATVFLAITCVALAFMSSIALGGIALGMLALLAGMAFWSKTQDDKAYKNTAKLAEKTKIISGVAQSYEQNLGEIKTHLKQEKEEVSYNANLLNQYIKTLEKSEASPEQKVAATEQMKKIAETLKGSDAKTPGRG